jgi:hypothetical protein
VGFNNLEQGFLLAFAGAVAFAAWMSWLALKTLALNSISTVHHARRQAEALESIARHADEIGKEDGARRIVRELCDIYARSKTESDTYEPLIDLWRKGEALLKTRAG